MFNSSEITDTLVDIDISACSSSQYLFGYCSLLHTVRKLIVSENVSFVDSFISCRALKNIRFEGTIGKSIDFSYCPLTPESMVSVITHLYDFGYDGENAYTCTVSFSENCWEALENSYDVHDYHGNMASWQDYCTYMGWNT
jgi:hypothetical protein